MGKRKVYEDSGRLAHTIHNFSTSPKIVQLRLRALSSLFILTAIRKFSNFSFRKKLFRPDARKFFACGKEFRDKTKFSFNGLRDDRIRKFQSGRRR